MNKKSNSRRTGKTLWSGVVFGGLFTVAGIIAFFTVVTHELSRVRIDWMDVMASSLFLVFFVVPGAALVRWSLNRKTVTDLIAQARDEGVPSEEKSLYRVFYIIAAFLSATAVPILIGGIIEKKSGPMAMLLFLVIAAGFLWAGKRQRRRHEAIGSTLLQLDPVPGRIGGQLGGSFRLGPAVHVGKMMLRLSCLHTYTSGSGSNSSTETSVLFQKEMRPYTETGSTGETELRFLFDVPDKLPETDEAGYRGSIYWEVRCQGTIKMRRTVNGKPADFWLEFKRHWRVPMLSGKGLSERELSEGERSAGDFSEGDLFTEELFAEASSRETSSAVNVPKEHLQQISEEALAASRSSLEQQFDVRNEQNVLHISSEPGRHKSMWQAFGGFGVAVLCVAAFLAYQYSSGSNVPLIMVLAFPVIGLALTGLGVYLAGRGLETRIEGNQVRTLRSLFGKTVYQRRAVLTSARQMWIKKTMSSQSQDKTLTEYFALYMDYGGRQIKLVEAIEGEGAALLMQQRIERFLKD